MAGAWRVWAENSLLVPIRERPRGCAAQRVRWPQCLGSPPFDTQLFPLTSCSEISGRVFGGDGLKPVCKLALLCKFWVCGQTRADPGGAHLGSQASEQGRAGGA